MPIIKVTTPDGQTYNINAPEGGTQEQAFEYVETQLMTGKAKPSAPASTYKPTAGSMAGRGMTLGASDYVAAAGDYVGDKLAAGLGKLGADVRPGTGDLSYEDALRNVRQGVENYRDESPVTATVSEIAGGIASPVLATKALDVATGVVKPVTGSVTAAVERALDMGGNLIGRNLPTWMRAGVQGGVDGVIYGAATAQNEQGGLPTMDDLVKQSITGGAWGVGLGAAAKPAFDSFGWATRKLRDGAQTVIDKLPFGQESGAARKVAENLARDNITPEMLAANRAKLGPGATVVDAAGMQDPATGVWLGGRNTFGAADSLANMPGRTQDLAERVMKPRASLGASELMASVRRDISPKDFRQTFDTISTEMKDKAAPLYKEAFQANKSVASPVIDRILNTPAGKEAMDYAYGRMQNRMSRMAVPDEELTAQMKELVEAGKMLPVKGGVASGLKLQTLDLIKQALGETEQQLKRKVIAGTAKKGELSDITELRQSLTRELDRLDATAKAGPNSTKAEGGAYARARKVWADDTALLESMESGRDFMRGERDLVAKEFKELTDGERDLYMVGMAKEIQDAIEKTGTVPPRLKHIMNKENGTRKLLQEILPPEQFDGFLNTVAGIVRKGETARMIGGSQTFSRGENAADLGLDLGGAAIEAARGNFSTAGGNLLRGGMNWLKRPSEGMRDAMGEMMLDPAQFDNALNSLRSRAQLSANPTGVFQPGAFSSGNLLRALPLGVR